MASAPGGRVLAVRAAGSEVQLSFAGLADLLGASSMKRFRACPRPSVTRSRRRCCSWRRRERCPTRGRSRLDCSRLCGCFRRPLRSCSPSTTCSGSTLHREVRCDSRFGGWRPSRFACSPPCAVRPAGRFRSSWSARSATIVCCGSPLAPLSLGTLHELLRARLGLNLPRPALVRVAEVCSGNPFFALELGRELQRRGARPAAGEPLPVPSNLRQLVRDRIARLPARTRMLVLSAAALAQPTVAILAAASGDAAPPRISIGPCAVACWSWRASACASRTRCSPRRRTHRLRPRTGAPSTDTLARAATEPQERARHLALAATGASEDIAAALDDAAVHARRRGAPDAAADCVSRPSG